MVQKVDGEVPGRGAEVTVSAQQGQHVYEEPSALQERGVGAEGGQLQFLEEDGEQRRLEDMEIRRPGAACLWTGGAGNDLPGHPRSFV